LEIRSSCPRPDLWRESSISFFLISWRVVGILVKMTKSFSRYYFFTQFLSYKPFDFRVHLWHPPVSGYVKVQTRLWKNPMNLCDKNAGTVPNVFKRIQYRTNVVRDIQEVCSLWNDRDLVVYHESRKRDLKTRPMYECRCDERLKTKVQKSTRFVYTELFGEPEHLKI
jgi:hypothetical protein